MMKKGAIMAARVDWREIEPWEPEETIGKLWHGWASGFDSIPEHEDARVALSEVAGRLAVLFRGLEIGRASCRERV